MELETTDLSNFNKGRGYKENSKIREDSSVKELFHRLDSKLETKFDIVDNKINSINHNVEMLDAKVDQKFETLSSKENHVDHKLDSLESKMNRKVDDMQVKAEQTFTVLATRMDRPGGGSTWPMSSFWYWLLGLDVILTVICRLL